MPLPSSSRLLSGLLALALAGCTPLPDFAAFPEGADAPPPALLPIDRLLAGTDAPAMAEAQGQGLSARAARLRARAALMRGPVHDPATRARLAAAVRAGRA